MDISVIVPVYNTKEYMGKCIDSVLSQTGVSFEIILVDDGSTDGSSQLCDSYDEKYECVRVIHKRNEGLGYARNSGLDIAAGQYIFFLDSDDWMTDGALSRLFYLVKHFQVDIVCFQRAQTYEKDYVQTSGCSNGRVMNRYELIKAYFDDIICTSACLALYDKRIFDQVRFSNVALHEDAYSKHLFLNQARNGYVTDEVFYVQYMRGNSLTRTAFSDKNMVSIECGERLVRFVRDQYPDLLGKAYENKLERERSLIDDHILEGRGYRANKEYFWKVINTISEDLKAVFTLNDRNGKQYKKLRRMVRHPYLHILWHKAGQIKDKCVLCMAICYRRVFKGKKGQNEKN